MNRVPSSIVWLLPIVLAVLTITAVAQEPEPIPLPKPQMEGGRPLMDVLKDRQSTKEFADKRLSDQVLSDLLWAAWGINRPETGKRTAPSSRNCQEMDVYVTRADGVYLFDAQAHALKPVLDEDIRAATGGQEYVKTAPINLVYVADYAKMADKTDDAKQRTSAIDTGLISQNVYLYCASEGLGTVVREVGNKPALAKMMGLREDQHIVLAQSVGYPKEQSLNATLSALLEQTMRDHDIPGIAVALFDSDTIVIKEAMGKRRLGGEEDIRLDDRFHVGSNTKAMTATMIASLVEDGSLSWEATPMDIFPELAESIHEASKAITLRQLLTHRAGVQPFTDDREFDSVPKLSGTPLQQRYQCTEYLLTSKPFKTPGEAFEYSNAGYSIATAMAERVTGKPWQELIGLRLFDKLGLDAGFGWPALSDPNQPWGHVYEGQLEGSLEEWQERKSGKLQPHPPTDSYKIRPATAPAGDVNLSIIDFAKFVQMHLRGCRGTQTVLKAETVQSMHKDVQGYALGWCVTKKGEIIVSSHNGSAGTFYSQAVLFPLRDFGIVVACNAGHMNAWEGCEKLVQALFDRVKDSGLGEGKPNNGVHTDALTHAGDTRRSAPENPKEQPKDATPKPE